MFSGRNILNIIVYIEQIVYQNDFLGVVFNTLFYVNSRALCKNIIGMFQYVGKIDTHLIPDDLTAHKCLLLVKLEPGNNQLSKPQLVWLRSKVNKSILFLGRYVTFQSLSQLSNLSPGCSFTVIRQTWTSVSAPSVRKPRSTVSKMFLLHVACT